VSLPRYPLRINVGFLVNQPIGTSRDIQFEFPAIRLSSDLEITQFSSTVQVGRTPQGILVQAQANGTTPAQCVRCLIDFQLPLHCDFSELYAFDSRSISESGLILSEDGNIDLAPLFSEYFLLEIDIKPLCKPDCKGLCPICGEDLNVTTCEHQAMRVE
jgi:uncharacterized protein